VPTQTAQRRRLATLPQRIQIELSLDRLTRFAGLEREYAGQLNAAGVRLLRSSTFAAYCDCRALGVGKRADQILAKSPTETLGDVAILAS